tara:strand:+ start:2619 stop:3266 length:648 start_codon:yes stop_codon:yes gene_type:complete
LPDFKIESTLVKPVIGIDEVGRGPLAGPVVSCACVFYNTLLSYDQINMLNDSKKLSKKNRLKALKLIYFMKKNKKLNFALGYASVEEIDNKNILQATIISMKRALLKLNLNEGSIIVDGNFKFTQKKFTCTNIVNGDQLSISIATASIIAKLHRDRYMRIIGSKYPNFNWVSNSGYGTKEHIKQIYREGINIHHRKSFAPIKNLLNFNKSTYHKR